MRVASREKLENCRLHTSSKAPRTKVGLKMHKHKKPEEKKKHNMFGTTGLNLLGLSKKHTVMWCALDLYALAIIIVNVDSISIPIYPI